MLKKDYILGFFLNFLRSIFYLLLTIFSIFSPNIKQITEKCEIVNLFYYYELGVGLFNLFFIWTTFFSIILFDIILSKRYEKFIRIHIFIIHFFYFLLTFVIIIIGIYLLGNITPDCISNYNYLYIPLYITFIYMIFECYANSLLLCGELEKKINIKFHKLNENFHKLKMNIVLW